MLLACSKNDEPATTSEIPEASEPKPTPAVESIVSDGDSKETASQWSPIIKGELKSIAKAIGHPEKSVLALAETIAMSDPADAPTEELHHGSKVSATAMTMDQAPMKQVSRSDFLKELAELVQADPEAGDGAIRFKLYGIDRDGETLKTRQRLMASGRNAEGRRLYTYSVTDAVWELPADSDEDGVPRLREFVLGRVIQNERLQAEDSFVDLAGHVLGKNAAWNDQLQHGMNTWAHHIERSLNPDFLGYHGVAMGDVNGDGLEDLYLCQPGGLPNLLFKQEPDGTLTDISKAARVDWLDNSTAALLVDLDNDGDKDLSVATRTAFLIMENNGSGRFSLRERLTAIGNGYSPTAADYDNDGDLDLLVLRYQSDEGKVGDFPTPHPFHSARNGGSNVLLQNQGDFTFDNVTDDAGLGVENYRFSFAASWEDYDNDGDADLYIANDFGPNQLFRNEGTHFVDESHQSGSEDWGFGMSATWGDYDRDGYMDLYVSSMFSGAGNQIVAQSDFNPTMPEETRRKYLKMVRGNSLLKNGAGSGFSDATTPADEGFAGWAWGAKFGDLNNDGWEDLYVANGYISQPDTDDL